MSCEVGSRPSTQVPHEQRVVRRCGAHGHDVRPRIVPDGQQRRETVPRQGLRQPPPRYLDTPHRTVGAKLSAGTWRGAISDTPEASAGKVAVRVEAVTAMGWAGALGKRETSARVVHPSAASGVSSSLVSASALR